MPLPCVRVRVKPVAVTRPDVVVAEELRMVSVTDAKLTVKVVARLVLVLVTVEGPVLVLSLPLPMLREATVRPTSEVDVTVDSLRVT